MRHAVIIGGGPAGLAAADELLRCTDIIPVVIEQEPVVGGISRTLEYKGNKFDIGPHRFFTKENEVAQRWHETMPLTSHENPEKKDQHVFLTKRRLSRIAYNKAFFDYPLSLSIATLHKMGVTKTCAAGFGFCASILFKRPERSLEDFMINRFGVPLYRMFFEDYTRKVWGLHPSRISASWGAQRIKSLSLGKAIISAFKKMIGSRQASAPTSLTETFIYPAQGSGDYWQTLAASVIARGGTIMTDTKASSITFENGSITSVTVKCKETISTIETDTVFSSAPIKELVAMMQFDIPTSIAKIADGLPYRDYQIACVQLPAAALKYPLADHWVYLQEPAITAGRMIIFNNWSHAMINDPHKTLWIGFEYFCDENDDLWKADDQAMQRIVTADMSKLDFFVDGTQPIDFCRVRQKKAYPSYWGTYDRFAELKDFLLSIDGLHCIGRNGLHRYNNMDHSVISGIVAARAAAGLLPKTAVWDINTDDEYHEEKKS